MKAKELSPPFQWANRRVLLKDRILHVPPMCDYQSFDFPGWKNIFNNPYPVHLEYCSGNGDWIAEKAKKNPDANWVAVEKQFRRVRKIWAKMKTENLSNLLIICGEAYLVSNLYLPTASLAAIYINFPDPWPKKRHAKHRLIQRPFLDEVYRLLLPDAPFTFVTDDQPYADHLIATMPTQPLFVKNSLPGYGGSWFDTLWRQLGREIHYVRYTR